MVGVVKVENMDLNINHREIRQIFKDHGARPADVHMVTDIHNERTGSCFLSFEDNQIAKLGLNVDGVLYKNKRVEVRESNPSEFNRYFPGVSLISKPPFGKRKRKGAPQIMRNGKKMAFQNEGKPFSFRSRSPAGQGRGYFGDRGRPAVDNIRGNLDASFERKRFDNHPRDFRDRSRSPINKRAERGNAREEFLRSFAPRDHSSTSRNERRSSKNNGGEHKALAPYHDPLHNLNVKKFVKVKGLPYNVSEVEIQNFFRPILTRDIFYLKHHVGKFAGERNGSGIIEFFSENDAKQCIKLDGKRFRSKVTAISRTEKHEIVEAIQARLGNKAPQPAEVQSSSATPDLSNLTNMANNNPQVAHLLNLLTETVNAIATASSSNSPANDSRGKRVNKRRNRGKRQANDPVVSRVANSANVDVNDITMGRVVGIRNLPYSVTPGEILQFFQGFHSIRDSVRIHYLDDGKCSGDAIISFRGNNDAEKAVAALNKKTIANRKVELFLL